MGFDRELIAASTTPIILSILERRRNEGGVHSYGYSIIKEVASLSQENMQWTEGMLYPVLHRLERNGFLRSHWGRSESGRRRKYYGITESGIAELQRLKSQWETVDSILRSNWNEKN